MVSEKSFLCDSWKTSVLLLPVLGKKNLTAIEAGIPGNARERGVCALGFALGPDNFCSNKTARVLSAVQTSCLFAGRNFQGILDDCVTQI